MDEVVYIVRQFNMDLKCLAILGAYRKEETAVQELMENHPDLTFNNILWRYEDKTHGLFYRIDAFTLK